MYGKPVGWIVIKQITKICRSQRPLTIEVYAYCIIQYNFLRPSF